MPVPQDHNFKGGVGAGDPVRSETPATSGHAVEAVKDCTPSPRLGGVQKGAPTPSNPAQLSEGGGASLNAECVETLHDMPQGVRRITPHPQDSQAMEGVNEK